MNQNYNNEQRRQLDFLCEQVKHLEAVLKSTPKEDKTYAQQMRIYLATVKEIRALRSTVSSRSISWAPPEGFMRLTMLRAAS